MQGPQGIEHIFLALASVVCLLLEDISRNFTYKMCRPKKIKLYIHMYIENQYNVTITIRKSYLLCLFLM